ncbi:MAG: Mpo1-like protein [Pseudomonadota bacterium]
MANDSKLMDMLTGYAAAHQHPMNVFVHLIGIPTIMFGVLIPLTWVTIGSAESDVNLAHLLVVAFTLFYMTLDRIFAIVFLIFGLLLAEAARWVGAMDTAIAWWIAAGAFFGGYAAQFIGHAIEKSMPVLVKHPIEAQLAAPFFTVVEIFKLLGLREDLFDQVQTEIARQRAEQA